MAQFRKKPVEIEARQWNGSPQSTRDVLSWIDRNGWAARSRWTDGVGEEILIGTLEGVMAAAPGDWIIKGVKGEFYPCKPDIFTATYDPVDRVVATLDADELFAEPGTRRLDPSCGSRFAIMDHDDIPEIQVKRGGVKYPAHTPADAAHRRIVERIAPGPMDINVTDMLQRFGGTVGPAIEAEL